MGQIVTAACTCGYSEPELFVGGGMATYMTIANFPALCKQGKHIATVNLLADELVCPDGHSGRPLPYYNASELQIEPGKFLVSEWDGYQLNDGAYLCPSCGEHSLRFRLDALFD